MSRLRSVEYKWLVAIVFVAGLFMDLLDTTIVNVALPRLGVIFGANTTTLEWVVTGYLLSLAVWIPASGWLGDRIGTRRVFLFALAAFTIGSALCGLSTSIGMLIAFRVVQGIGGGMMTPVGTAMLFRAFPPQERAKASAVLVIPVAIAPAIGPVLGGLLVDNLSWRWIFYVNVPVGIAAFIFAFLFLKESREDNPGKFDIAGFLLSAAGLPLVLYALAEAPNRGWTSPVVLATGLSGIALLALLVIVERRVEQPMLTFRLFGDRIFRSATITMFWASAAFVGLLFLLPLYLQNLRGLSATQSGLTTFPQAIGLIVMSRYVSKLFSTVGPRRLMMIGTLGAAIASLAFQFVGLETSQWWIRLIMLFRGMSFAFALIPVQAATFSNVKPHDTGRASSLFNTNRQVASSVGVAIVATVLLDRSNTRIAGALRGIVDPVAQAHAKANASMAAFHDAYLAVLVIALLAFVATFLIHDEDAAASMVPKTPGDAPAVH